MPISTFNSSSGTRGSFISLLGGRLINAKSFPFSLALVQLTFTKCMNAALVPLGLQGIRVLNYLDDWLILAHSRESVSYNRDVVLRHVRALGLRTNNKKSVFSPPLNKLRFWEFTWIPLKCRSVWLLPGFPASIHVWPALS